MSKKRAAANRKRQVERARRGNQRPQRPRPAGSPPARKDERKRQMTDLWISLGIVAVVILLVYLAVRFTRSGSAGTEVPTATAEATSSITAAPTAAASGTAEAVTAPESTPVEETPVAKSWSQPPAMALDPNVDYQAVIKTAKGDVVIDLYEDEAPVTVNNFVFLARQGFYDGVTFHRVIAGFMAQTGDPTGTGGGGPGYQFADEFSPNLRHDAEGIVSMANAGSNTNGSQFFITYAPQPHLDGKHSVFGKVIEGLDVLRSITPRDPSARPTPPPGDRILTIEIVEK